MSEGSEFLSAVDGSIGKMLDRHGYARVSTEEAFGGALLTVRFERDGRWVNVVWDTREEDLTVRVGPHAGTRWGESIGEMVTKCLRQRDFDVDRVLHDRAPGVVGELQAYCVLLDEYLSRDLYREDEK